MAVDEGVQDDGDVGLWSGCGCGSRGRLSSVQLRGDATG